MNYSTNELINIVNTEELFIDAFNQKKSFFLKQLENKNIFPKKDILKKINNPLIISFFKKNYEIDEKDLDFFKNKINYDEYELLENKFQSTNVSYYFDNNKDLPGKIELKIDDIYKYKKNIKTLLSQRDQNIKLILKDSFNINKVKIDDFLNIYNMLEIDDLNFFSIYKEFGKIDKYKEIYKNYFKKTLSLNINNFFAFVPNYEILPSEHAWFKEILQKQYNLNYREVQSYGITSLFTKIDFFINFSKNDISYFSKEELEANIDKVQDVLYKEIDKRTYEKFSVFKYLQINEEQYPILFNDNFIENILNINPDINFFVYPDKDITESSSILKYLYEKIVHNINYKMENNLLNLNKNIQFYDIINLYIILTNKKTLIDVDKVSAEAEKLGKNIIEYLSNNSSLFMNMNVKYLNKVFNDKSKITKYNPNIFYILLDLLNNPHIIDNTRDENLIKNINNNIRKCLIEVGKTYQSNNDLLSMWNIFQFFQNTKEGLSEKLSKNLNKLFLKLNVNNLEIIIGLKENINNIFDFETNKIKFEDYHELINEVRPDFKNFLLKNGLFSESLLGKLLYESDNNIEFLKQYIHEHKTKIEENDYLLKQILKNKNQNKIYALESFDNDSNNFKDYNQSKEDFQQLKELINFVKITHPNVQKNYFENDHSNTKLLHIKDYKNELKNLKETFQKIQKFTSEEYQDYLDDCQKVYSYLDKKIYDLKYGFSFEFLKEETFKYYKNSDFDGLKVWFNSDIGGNSDLKQHIYECISLISFKELRENLNNDTFIELLWNGKNYRKSNFTFNGDYTKEENSIIAEIMLSKKNQKFPTDSLQEKEEIFYFFKEKNYDFIKNFIIEKTPELILFSNKLYPNSYFNKLKTKKMIESFNLDEIFNIFENINKKYNSYIPTDLCWDYSKDLGYFFNGVYKENNLNNYIKDINIIKEKNPAIYVLMLNHKIHKNFVELSENRKNEHNLLHKIIDVDAYLNGVNSLLEHAKTTTNSSVAKTILESLNHIQLDYEVDKLLHKEYKTNFSEENIEKFILNQFKNNPLALSNEHYMGITDIPTYLEKNIFNKLTNQDIKDFFQPHLYFFEKQEINKSSKLIDISTKLINHVTNTKNKELLEWLIVEFETFLVIEKQLSYNEKEKFYKELDNKSMDVIKIISNEIDIEQLLETSKLFMDLDTELISNKVNNKIKRKI